MPPAINNNVCRNDLPIPIEQYVGHRHFWTTLEFVFKSEFVSFCSPLGSGGTTILLDDDDLNFSLALHERLMERKVRQQKQNWTTITPTGQYVLWLCWMGETVGW